MTEEQKQKIINSIQENLDYSDALSPLLDKVTRGLTLNDDDREMIQDILF